MRFANSSGVMTSSGSMAAHASTFSPDGEFSNRLLVFVCRILSRWSGPPDQTYDSDKDRGQSTSHKQVGQGLRRAHFFTFNPSSTSRRMASIMNVGRGRYSALLRYVIFDVANVGLEWRQPS